MRLKIGLMGSAAELSSLPGSEFLKQQAQALGSAIANAESVLLTGATTGLVYEVGKAARANKGLHIGVSPASNELEHVERFALPVDACDVIIYTGFGLKGRNVVLVRSSDIVLFINGAMGSLNEFTIAHDEGKVIGCLLGTGGVADQTSYLLDHFSFGTWPEVIQENNPAALVDQCIEAFRLRK
jgi:uncharacterized protein (TIGR00725 family)